MNTITALRMSLVLLLLCSGLLHTLFASQRLRYFGEAPKKDSNKECAIERADKICENKTSFVTVYDEEDAKFLYKYTDRAETSGDVRKVWLGLHHVGNYTWSNGEPVIFNQTSETLKEGEQKCEAIHEGKWQSFNCSEKKSFMCFKGDNYTLHSANNTWCQAHQHCRNTHSELVSINSTDQNEAVIEKGNGSSFWIGLRRDEWTWFDNGCSSFREWIWNEDRSKKHNCTSMAVEEKSEDVRLYNYGCDNDPVPLYAAGHVRIKVINESKTWEGALNYCMDHHSRPLWIKDKYDQEAVVQWLKRTDVNGPFWIGLRQSRVFGFWIWSDAMVVYSNWWNRKEPEPSMYNLCGVIDEETDYMWYEKDCETERPFLCEEDIIYM